MNLSFGWVRTIGLGLALAGVFAAPRAQADNDVGYLTVKSVPAAHILIDDKDTGLSTPQTKMKLEVGRHRLTLVSSDQKLKRSLGFAITKDKETQLNVNL
jgi:PEGA domain